MTSKKSSPENNEQTFRLIFEKHAAIMLLIEPQTGVILDANQAAVDFYGYSKSKLRGMSISEINTLPPEQAAAARQKALDGEQNYIIFPHRLASGEVRIVEVHSSPIALQEQQVLFSIIHDITKRRRTEEALQESETHYRALIEGTPAIVYSFSNKHGGVYYSEHVVDILGYSPEQLYAQPGLWRNSIHPDDLSSLDQRNLIATDGKTRRVEYRIQDAHGNWHWFDDHAFKYQLKDGESILEGRALDITARKQAEEALHESKFLFHLLIESLPQNIYAKSVDGRFIFANQQYCATQGKLLEEIVGKTDFELHPPELAEKYRIDDQQVIATGKTIELIEEHQPLGKNKFFVQVIKTPFYYSKGQPFGILGIFWDITERKHAENELRRAKEALETAHRELEQSFAREQQLARTDALTGVNSRGYLLELAAHEFEIAMRYHAPLTMLMVDIDRFKQINDTFGHAIGDQAIQHIAQIVRAEIRSVDVIGRYGAGDEFIILLPQTSIQEAIPLAERIHASIAAMRMETDQSVITLTISLGIAQTIHIAPKPEDTAQPDTVENLFLRADQALYAAKQAGRNRTVIFGQE